MLLKTFLPLCIVIFIAQASNAQHLRHTFSVMGNLHTANNGTTYTVGQEGSNRIGGISGPSFGYKIAYTFNPEKDLFFETGILHYTNKAKHTPLKTDSRINSVSEYGEKFINIMVPLHLGKSIVSKNRKYVDIKGGVSLGYVWLMEHSVGSYSQSNSSNDTFIHKTTTNIANTKGKLMASVDAGINVAPFWKLPQLNFGLMLSYNVLKTPTSSFSTITDGGRHGTIDRYALESNYNFINCLFSINYSFGKKWKKHLIYEEVKS